MTIRRQLTKLVVAALLPAVLAGGLLIVHSYEHERENIAERTMETARDLVQQVDQELANARSALQVLSTSPHLASGDLLAFDRQAREALAELPGDSVVVSDASGQQLVNTLLPFGATLPHHANLEQVRRVFETGRPAISDLLASPAQSQWVIAIDVPVRRNGNVLYDMSLWIPSSHLAEMLRRQQLPPGWIGAIVDSRGVVVARTHEAGRFVGHEVTPALLQRLTRDREGQVETESLEGTPVVSVFSRSSVSDWAVAIGIPRAELARELWIPIAWLIAGSIVLLATSIVLAQRVSARISRSIRNLIAPAAALARGEEIVVPPLELAEAQEVGHALEDAARMLREREEILAVVSHDLRSPLSSFILGTTTAERMAARIPGGEAVRAVLASLTEVARHMSGTVNDLLAVAVSTRGRKSMMTLRPVDAASLLERAAGAMGQQFAKSGVELVIDRGPPLQDVQADPDRLLRVFVNLLDNALKFTQAPGRVVLSARPHAGGVLFCVSNSGKPLPADVLDKLFEPFWQASEDKRGAGLGLSICRSIVETHGGRIWAEPEPGMCVRVCFNIPRVEPPPET